MAAAVSANDRPTTLVAKGRYLFVDHTLDEGIVRTIGHGPGNRLPVEAIDDGAEVQLPVRGGELRDVREPELVGDSALSRLLTRPSTAGGVISPMWLEYLRLLFA